MWSRFRKDTRGAAAIEFGIIASLLTMFLLGVVEFGFIFYTQNTAQNAARDAARRFATNRITSQQAKDAVLAQMPGWASANTTVTVSETTPGAPATNLITVTVSLPALKATPSNFLRAAYESKTFQSKAVVQQEVVP